MNARASIKGWCPGALRPMESGDGLIVRVRISAGILSPATAARLAEAARLHGNGLVDLSNRGNLQLRGVRASSLPALQAELADLGLLDADIALESVRNIIASPLAGHDPTILIDVASAVRSLEGALAEAVLDPAQPLAGLPAKFGFVIDGGGMLPLDTVEADVAFIAVAGGRVRVEVGGVPVDEIDETDIAVQAVRLASLFLAERWPEERRMAPFAARRFGRGTQREVKDRRPRAQSTAAASFAVAAAPFGRLTADQLAGLAALAKGHEADLRLTPWRAILMTAAVPSPSIAALGLRTRLDDPLLSIAACPGAPACRSGEAATQADALRLADLLGDDLALVGAIHVSGCPKGCARKAPAAVSLTAEAGRYGLAFAAAAADPRATNGLTIEAAAALIRGRTGMQADA